MNMAVCIARVMQFWKGQSMAGEQFTTLMKELILVR